MKSFWVALSLLLLAAVAAFWGFAYGNRFAAAKPDADLEVPIRFDKNELTKQGTSKVSL